MDRLHVIERGNRSDLPMGPAGREYNDSRHMGDSPRAHLYS